MNNYNIVYYRLCWSYILTCLRTIVDYFLLLFYLNYITLHCLILKEKSKPYVDVDTKIYSMSYLLKLFIKY